MDWATIHLATHHFPVVLSLVGAVAVPIGLALRRQAAIHFGAVSVALAGATAPIAYLSGRLAAARVLGAEAGGALASELAATLESHSTLGLAASAALLAAAAAAWAWLRVRPDRRVVVPLVILSLLAAALTAAAGRAGGLIRHDGAVTDAPSGPNVRIR
ncbi:MAG: hypothetical protein JSV95_08295 [Gemmatimonadota bacterium]|jgi:uncharacterized membrane protein|nr:MAG: hypothetical protein JSV95_08295 [Gemmatimonadota bacterium]